MGGDLDEIRGSRVVDTSAWVEYLRQRETPADVALTRLVEKRAAVAVTEVVVLEVLAGARSERHADDLRETRFQFPVLKLRSVDGYEEALYPLDEPVE